MAYTLAGIRQRVLEDKLDDTEFTGAIVDRFINDTQRSIFNTYELPFMEKVFAGTLPLGEYIFAFPADYQILQALKIISPDGSIKDISDNYIPFREFNRVYPVPSNNTAGVPAAWTLHGNQLYLDKPTDQIYVLEMHYLKKPATLTDDGDIPALPYEFEELLVLGAYYRVLERNEDFDLAAFYKNGDYTDELDKLEARYGKRHSSKTHTMGQPYRVAYGRRSGRH